MNEPRNRHENRRGVRSERMRRVAQREQLAAWRRRQRELDRVRLEEWRRRESEPPLVKISRVFARMADDLMRGRGSAGRW